MTIGRTTRQLLYTVVFLAFLKSCAPLFAEEPWLKVEVSPKMSTAPINSTGTIRISVTIPRNDQNRFLCFGYDGTTFRQSCQEHVAQTGPYRVEQTFKGVTPGRYVAFASLVRDEGEKGVRNQVATTEFVICGDGGCEQGEGVAER